MQVAQLLTQLLTHIPPNPLLNNKRTILNPINKQ